MMKSVKSIDRFQIAGFILSTLISIILVIRGQDTISSVILGLTLAILTQLFDIQLRNTETENKLLDAISLDTRLFDNPEFLNQIKQILEDYYTIQEGWFDHFKDIANDSLDVCQYNLHALANGHIALPPYSSFSYTSKGLRDAKKCVCTVALSNMQYWRSNSAQKYIQANREALQRGVDITRIFVQYPENLEPYKDILTEMIQMGVSLYTVSPDDVPSEIKRDMNILDEKILVHMELTNDGNIREDIITIDPVNVKQAINDFKKLKGFATKFTLDD